MKLKTAISIIICFVCVSSGAQSLVEHNVDRSHYGEDPCLAQIQKIVKKTEFLVETDSSEYATAKGLSEASQLKLFGRFFKTTMQVEAKVKSKVYWTIPYAQGQACIVRDIKRL